MPPSSPARYQLARHTFLMLSALYLSGCDAEARPAAGATAASTHASASAAQSTIPRERPVPRAQLEALLAPKRAALEATRRPVHHVELVDFPEDTPTASKVGGRAWWPASEAPPTTASGQPLVLLAQLDFAELPATPGYPDRGLVQFFISGNDFYGANFHGSLSESELQEQRDFRVVYWPDTSLDSKPLPVVAGEYLPHSPEKPRRMRFHPGNEPISAVDHRFRGIWGGDVYAALEAFAQGKDFSADDLQGALYEQYQGSGHKVGGYPHFTQEDPRDGGRWELLLQLDTDEHMMWGDSGVGGFFIAPDDLARADFSRVLYTWDCY